jgi:hypothetical protein
MSGSLAFVGTGPVPVYTSIVVVLVGGIAEDSANVGDQYVFLALADTAKAIVSSQGDLEGAEAEPVALVGNMASFRLLG